MSDFIKQLPPEAWFGQCVQTTTDLIRQGPIEIAREERWLKTWALNGFRKGADAECRDAAQELLERLISTHSRHLDATLILSRPEKLHGDILPILVPIAPSELALHSFISNNGPIDTGIEPPTLEKVIENVGVHFDTIVSIPHTSAFGCIFLPTPAVKWIDHFKLFQRGWGKNTEIRAVLSPVFDLLEAATS